MAKTTKTITINRSKFYDAVRSSVFEGRLSSEQVRGMEYILDAIERHGVLEHPPIFAGYILATAYAEVGPAMQPVREGFKHSDLAAREHVALLYRRGRISRDYARREPNGKSYYGRGYPQLTWPHNYRRLGNRLGLDLYDNPDLALIPRVSADILVVGMMEGLFTDDRLSDYLPRNPRMARKVVNALNNADRIAEWAQHFTAAIEIATEIAETTEKPVEKLGWWAYIVKAFWNILKALGERNDWVHPKANRRASRSDSFVHSEQDRDRPHTSGRRPD